MNRIKRLPKFVGGVLFIFCFVQETNGQSFAPPPDYPGSTAIHKDSSVFVNWASGITLTRGPLNIQNLGLGLASYGADTDALGIAEITPVSLGDGGEAILTFPFPIMNGSGPDFAVFENGFTNHYMEFAFVEVSSDGVNFFRFDGVSEAPTDVQLSNFSFSDCAYIHNLAGKYRQLYGTPFDLDEMNGITGLNVNNITHIRLIDVVGSINPQYGTLDSQGNIINDPYPTEFESGGFDLDAIGVIHQSTTSGIDEESNELSVYPNPFDEQFQCELSGKTQVTLRNIHGQILVSREESSIFSINLTEESDGMYFLTLETEGKTRTIKLIKQ